MNEKAYLTKTLPALTMDKETIEFVKTTLMDKRKDIYKLAKVLTPSVFIPQAHNLLGRYMTLPALEAPDMQVFYERMVDKSPQKRVVRKANPSLRDSANRKKQEIEVLDGVLYNPAEYRFINKGRRKTLDYDFSGTDLSSLRENSKTMSKYFIKSRRQRGKVLNERLKLISSNHEYQQELTDQVSYIITAGKQDAKEMMSSINDAISPLHERRQRLIAFRSTLIFTNHIFIGNKKLAEIINQGKKAMQFGYHKVDQDWNEFLKQKTLSPLEYSYVL